MEEEQQRIQVGVEPVGHHGAGPEFEPALGAVPDLPAIWPARNVHSDIEDLSRYAAYRLAGLRGGDGRLRAETFEVLHEPTPESENPAYPGGYAMG